MPTSKTQLFVIATPIGNLSDISPRSRLALESADTLFCEDTRETRKLLSALNIKSPRLERFDAHASREQIEVLVERMRGEGNTKGFALVSDAGTPGISDPGALLVKRALEAHIKVTPIPGPSALTTFLSASGFADTAFTFRGFFPKKEKIQIQELMLCSQSQTSRLFIWFESPKRIEKSLAILAAEFQNIRVVAAKELTKIHEQFFSGSASEVHTKVKAELETEGARGEWCFAVQFLLLTLGPMGPHTEHPDDATNSSDWVNFLDNLLKSRLSAPRAARQVSQYFGIPRKTVYEMALKILGKKI